MTGSCPSGKPAGQKCDRGLHKDKKEVDKLNAEASKKAAAKAKGE